MFDGITYGKAGSVLLMVENYVGEETFRKGVHDYLSAHLYSNATAEDFWGAQTATSNQPVDKIMESLVAQPGASLLTFSEPAGGFVGVEQRRFYLSPSIQPDPQQKWTLPVCFKTAGNGKNCAVLTPSDSRLKVPAEGIFYPNAGGAGYYRAAYPEALFKNLVERAETDLSPEERIRLVGDEWAQVRANRATAGDFLNLAAAVKDDASAYVIASSTSGVMAIYERAAVTKEERAALANWICATFGPRLAKLGEPSANDLPSTRELRARLFELLGLYGKDPTVISQARQIAEKYLADPGSVDATFGHSALAVAARNGDAAFFDQLEKVYETSTNPQMQQGALRQLANFGDPALARRALDYAVSNKVRNQDTFIQLGIALSVEPTRDQTWTYIKQNWDKVQSRLTTVGGGAIIEATSGFCTTEARDDVQRFFAEHKVAASNVSLTHAVDRINGCIEFRKLQGANLEKWQAAQPGS
jgi:aminopeptidase N/puromycin-sensitive aminopeptidase